MAAKVTRYGGERLAMMVKETRMWSKTHCGGEIDSQ